MATHLASLVQKKNGMASSRVSDEILTASPSKEQRLSVLWSLLWEPREFSGGREFPESSGLQDPLRRTHSVSYLKSRSRPTPDSPELRKQGAEGATEPNPRLALHRMGGELNDAPVLKGFDQGKVKKLFAEV